MHQQRQVESKSAFSLTHLGEPFYDHNLRLGQREKANDIIIIIHKTYMALTTDRSKLFKETISRNPESTVGKYYNSSASLYTRRVNLAL